MKRVCLVLATNLAIIVEIILDILACVIFMWFSRRVNFTPMW